MPRPTASVASQVHSSLRQGSLTKRERISSPSASLLTPIQKSRKQVTGLQTTQSYDNPGVTTVTSALGKTLPLPPMSWKDGGCDTSLSCTAAAENVPSSVAETEGSDVVQVLVQLGVAAWELDDVPRQIVLGKLDDVVTLLDELHDILCRERNAARSPHEPSSCRRTNLAKLSSAVERDVVTNPVCRNPSCAAEVSETSGGAQSDTDSDYPVFPVPERDLQVRIGAAQQDDAWRALLLRLSVLDTVSFEDVQASFQSHLTV